MNNKATEKPDAKRIDWVITLVPFALILLLSLLFFLLPTKSNEVLAAVRSFLGSE